MGRGVGETEQMILAAILRLGNRAYGVEIVEEIAARAGRTVGSGALSVALDRMERKGLVTTEAADPDPSRGGRPRRYATVTAEGVAEVRSARAAMLALWDGLGSALDR